ncbi:MAG: IS66 family insertion sequence element accessory protein TnpB [Bacillota bacterium]|nr:IS66 family insertion sequence element accessory protein TnpB [Bacillota bacterium]MDW7685310.1 IS66 family insertion sequence element accessory protein TnpB [Bacillota bacterium]
MISEASLERVYLATGVTDLRKSIDGLAVLVKEGFHLDPFSPCLFVFCNRKRDKLKILHWEHNGFWLYYRRLEKGKFQWPQNDGTDVTAVSRRELRWLLDGLPLHQRQAHREVTARTVL